MDAFTRAIYRRLKQVTINLVKDLVKDLVKEVMRDNDGCELKAEAEKLGYTVTKKPCYQCTCYIPYPNENHKKKDGAWKCIDKYEPIKYERKWRHAPTTRCKKKGEANE